MRIRTADEEKIRARAHQLWEEQGRPDGSATEHWLAAEREVLAAKPKVPERRQSRLGVAAKSAAAVSTTKGKTVRIVKASAAAQKVTTKKAAPKASTQQAVSAVAPKVAAQKTATTAKAPTGQQPAKKTAAVD